MNIVGLIPARGRSQGLPRKNVLPLAGKPLIAWTIEEALQSRELRQVLVSTDDEEIAQIAREYGAEVPFIRPATLAQDNTNSLAVVMHALHWLAEHEKTQPSYVMLLQPTSPLRTSTDIDGAIQLAKVKSTIAVVSVCEMKHHPYLSKCILDDGTLAEFVPNNVTDLRRQALPPAYTLNGAIYLNRRESLLHDQTFLPQGTYAYVMPPERSLDIDSPWDFYLADLILRDKYAHKSA